MECLSRSASERHRRMLVLIFLFSLLFTHGGRELGIIKDKGHGIEKRGTQLFHFLSPPKFPKDNTKSRLL